MGNIALPYYLMPPKRGWCELFLVVSSLEASLLALFQHVLKPSKQIARSGTKKHFCTRFSIDAKTFTLLPRFVRTTPGSKSSKTACFAPMYCARNIPGYSPSYGSARPVPFLPPRSHTDVAVRPVLIWKFVPCEWFPSNDEVTSCVPDARQVNLNSKVANWKEMNSQGLCENRRQLFRGTNYQTSAHATILCVKNSAQKLVQVLRIVCVALSFASCRFKVIQLRNTSRSFC